MIALRALSFNLLFFAWTALLAILYLPLLLAPRRVMVAAARFWIISSLALLRLVVGLRCELRGEANLPAGPVIIAAKHQSMWDTLIFHTLLGDPVFILKKELTRIPFFGWYLSKTENIAIDRAAGAKALRAMVDGTRQALAAGRQVVVFPEGTRTAPGARHDYQPGVAMVYSAAATPVVPVALNSGLYWGRRSFLKRPGAVVIEFLPPIPPGLDRRRFLARLEEQIETACERLHQEGLRRKAAGGPVDKLVDETAAVGRRGDGRG